jgi:ferredoxin--NADP+ reductase
MMQHAAMSDPVLPDAKMHLVTPANPVVGTLVASALCTRGKSHSFVRHIDIDVSATPLAGNFLVGQSFGVIPPGTDRRGKPHQVRLFSIASPSCGEDGTGNVLATTVKRVIDEFKPQTPGDDPRQHDLFLGVCSNYLCDLRPGAKVKVTGPNGKRFLLPAKPQEHDFLLVATGTGIAPYRGMVLELLDRPSGPVRSEIHLVMGSPYATDLLYDDLFRRLQSEHRNFHYHTAISREESAAGRPGRYVDRLIDDEIEAFAPLLGNPRTLIYICGLLGMQVGLFAVLARHGFGEAFLTVKPELAQIEPADWTPEQIKRHVRPTRRCMVEVY